jgi:hypothetical protein
MREIFPPSVDTVGVKLNHYRIASLDSQSTPPSVIPVETGIQTVL